MCIIAFLEHIYDTTELERREIITKIKDLAVKFKGKPIRFLWAQGGDHYDFE